VPLAGTIGFREIRRGCLILSWKHIINEQDIYVPISQIAGITELYADEITIQGSDRLGIGRRGWALMLIDSATEALFNDLLTKARASLFYIYYPPGARCLPTLTEPFDWGDIVFTKESAAYTDWGYFQHKSGGLNNLGVGFVGSLSVGWNRSLWSLFSQSLDDKPMDIRGLAFRDTAVVKGFVSFFRRYDKLPLPISTPELLNMEGGQWIAAAVSPCRHLTLSALGNVPWLLAYFRLDGFMIPFELWERASTEFRIFGDMVEANVDTGGGRQNCFLKARAAVATVTAK
jgi:hypothetical protein